MTGPVVQRDVYRVRAICLGLAVGALGLAPVAAGQEVDRTPKRGAYVGQVAGTRAYVAVVFGHGEVAGYVCDGKRFSKWFPDRRLRRGRATLVSRDRQAKLRVTFRKRRRVSGRLVRGQRRDRFRARLGRDDAGLYQGEEGERGQPGFLEGGWILLADGSQRGNTNFIDPITFNVNVRPAPRLDPRAGRVNTTQGFIDPIPQNTGFIDPHID